MEDNTIKDLVSDMLSNIVLGDKPEEEEVTSTGLMSSLPGIRTPTQVQQQDEQEAAPKARDKVKEFILRLSDEAEDTNSLRYSEKAAPEITDVMVDSETLLNRYDTPMYVYARNLRDYNPERSTIKVRNRGDHSERFLDQMYELARQSSEEAALARMEMGITESLPRSAPRMGFDVQGLIDAVNRENALRAGTKPLPSIPEVKTEELDDEEVAILSDTDIDTDDADGGAAPSDGKGLMSPSESLRPRARPEDVNPTLKKSSAEYELFDKIVGGESDDFNTIFRNSKIQTPKPLTEMTVREVRAWQEKSVAAGSKSSAVGRFQIIRKTMDTLIDNKVLSLDDVFNEETQTKAYTALLERRGYSKIKEQIQASKSMSEKKELAQKLQNNLAMEFASIPVATAIPKGKFGKYPLTDLVAGDTFYKDPKNPRLNKAQHKSEDFLSILMKL